MKKLCVILLFLLPVTAMHARAIQEDLRRDDERARLSYAFGMAIGFNLLSADMEFDYDAFLLGVRSILENTESWISEDEAIDMVEIALQEAHDRRLERNRLEELRFLAENMERSGVQVTPSGLQYEVLWQGDGERPGRNSIVRVHYEGFLTDGTLFDSSLIHGESVMFALSEVIPGWAEGIMLMNEGSRHKLFIPSRLAYGSRGIPQFIPPYSTLIFYVELLEIITQ